jgi:hypothetical protein
MTNITEILKTAATDYANACEKLLEVLEPVLHATKSQDLNSLLDAYIITENIKSITKAINTAINTHQPELAENAANMMMTTDTEAISRGGYTIRPDTKTYVSVNKDNKPYVLMWLKNHPEGRELVGEDYNANAFSAFIRGLMEEKGYSKDSEDLAKKLPTEISTFDKPVLQLRKKKS